MRVAAMAVMMAAGPAEETRVWVFFSPEAPGAASLLARLEGVAVRPVLLTESYFGAREPSEDFLAAVRLAGEMRVVDEEGLREAVRLGIRELPAVAVVRGRRAHVASGRDADVKEALRCAR